MKMKKKQQQKSLTILSQTHCNLYKKKQQQNEVYLNKNLF